VTYFPSRRSAQAISDATSRIFAEAERTSPQLYLAKLNVGGDAFGALHPEVGMDAPSVTVLRSCLMRPEQAEPRWVAAIADKLAELARGTS
jgi:hypothetical protein